MNTAARSSERWADAEIKAAAEMIRPKPAVDANEGARRRKEMLTSEMGGGALRRQHHDDGAASVYLYIMHSHFTSFQVLKWGVGCMIEPAEA